MKSLPQTHTSPQKGGITYIVSFEISWYQILVSPFHIFHRIAQAMQRKNRQEATNLLAQFKQADHWKKPVAGPYDGLWTVVSNTWVFWDRCPLKRIFMWDSRCPSHICTNLCPTWIHQQTMFRPVQVYWFHCPGRLVEILLA